VSVLDEQTLPEIDPQRAALLRGPLTLSRAQVFPFQLAERLGGRRATGSEVPRTLPAAPDAGLALVVARVFANCVLQSLLRQGAATPRRVLRQGKVLEGCLWDEGLNELHGTGSFTLAFTAAPAKLWWGLCHQVVSWSGPGARGPSPPDRHLPASLRVAPTPSMADALLFSLFHENLPRLLLPAPMSQRLQRALRAASLPVAWLQPDDPDLRAAAALDIALSPPLVRLLELSAPHLGAVWSARTAEVWRCRQVEELAGRARVFAARLRQLLRALDAAGRLDLWDPVLQALAALCDAQADLRAHVGKLAGVVTLADRDRAVAAVGELFSVLDDVDRLAQRLGEERYGDPRFAEAGLALATRQQILPPATRDALRSAARRLQGEVG
jgi:hypothetical protein